MSTFPKDDWAEEGFHVVMQNASAADRVTHWTREVEKMERIHAERPDWLTGRLVDAAREQLASAVTACRTAAGREA